MLESYHFPLPLLKLSNSAASYHRFSQRLSGPAHPPQDLSPALSWTQGWRIFPSLGTQTWPEQQCRFTCLQPWLFHQHLLPLTRSHGSTLDLLQHLPIWGYLWTLKPAVGSAHHVLTPHDSLSLSPLVTQPHFCNSLTDSQWQGKSKPIMSFSNSVDSAPAFTLFFQCYIKMWKFLKQLKQFWPGFSFLLPGLLHFLFKIQIVYGLKSTLPKSRDMHWVFLNNQMLLFG